MTENQVTELDGEEEREWSKEVEDARTYEKNIEERFESRRHNDRRNICSNKELLS